MPLFIVNDVYLTYNKLIRLLCHHPCERKFMTKHCRRSGFTLIELLIVVAIIAILAAIAVPNFLEAQTRAKVSRARADMRTMVTAIEAYAVDWSKYPNDYVLTLQTRPDGEFATAESFLPPTISTPVAYLTSSFLKDPFIDKGVPNLNLTNPYYTTLFYQCVNTSVRAAQGLPAGYTASWQPLAVGAINSQKSSQGWATIIPDAKTRYGEWKLGSLGPDRYYLGGVHIYDPTNGTVSRGDIYRTQKQATGGF